MENNQIKMVGGYSGFWGERDPRIAEYPLMDSPTVTFVLSALYLSFVKLIGPVWMKNRRPYELKHFMIGYNALLVAISSWLFINFGRYGWFTTYSWRGEPIDTSRSPDALKMVQICWVFYFSKLLEFADTIFFVLRKKDSQINFLHVFHHTTVPLMAWYGVTYGCGGYSTIFFLVNSFVHIWMYAYYGLAALGPAVQKYLWWKKYLTTLQMVQFCIILVFFAQLCMFPPANCPYTGFLVVLSLFPAVAFLILFMNFYRNSYQKPANKKKDSGKLNSHLNSPNDSPRPKYY